MRTFSFREHLEIGYHSARRQGFSHTAAALRRMMYGVPVEGPDELTETTEPDKYLNRRKAFGHNHICIEKILVNEGLSVIGQESAAKRPDFAAT